jgi:hypothetical protein
LVAQHKPQRTLACTTHTWRTAQHTPGCQEAVLNSLTGIRQQHPGEQKRLPPPPFLPPTCCPPPMKIVRLPGSPLNVVGLGPALL